MIDSLVHDITEMRNDDRFYVTAFHAIKDTFGIRLHEYSDTPPLTIIEKAYAVIRRYHCRRLSSLTDSEKEWLKINIELVASPLCKLVVEI